MAVTFSKVLAVNRGEIAIRIFRACYDLELHTVAMYSNEDINALFRTKADEAYLIGENQSPLGAYLDIPGIIALARRRGVDAIHPGYGFLSENADFARACEKNGIKFIGPPSHVLAQMGDKLAAKATAIACGVPIIPGSTVPLKDADEAVAKAKEYGFPIILKAAAGGGGRGMRRCDNEEDVRREFHLVKNEAKKAFGNEDIFIEKFLVEPKHIEVQILADTHGNVYHLGERDCSLQRRYQKVVEFAPAWSIPAETREKLHADHIGWLIFFTTVYIVSYVLNFTVFGVEMTPLRAVIELLPVAAMTVTTISFRMQDAGAIRRFGLFSSPAWLIYNISSFAVGAIICEVLCFGSILLGILRHDRTPTNK